MGWPISFCPKKLLDFYLNLKKLAKMVKLSGIVGYRYFFLSFYADFGTFKTKFNNIFGQNLKKSSDSSNYFYHP